MINGEFEKLLIEAIDESFSSLGESPKQAILFHLENTFKIKKQEIPNKIDSFDHAIKKLFGPLFTTKAKGMGLGLAICKRIVEAHGRRISVESVVEKGTTFTITVPIEPQLEEN